MASGLAPILRLPGKVNSSNALVVTGDAGAATGGGTNTVANTQGKVDASNQLVVVFVV